MLSFSRYLEVVVDALSENCNNPAVGGQTLIVGL